MSGVVQHGSEVSATITNSVEYAPYIEYGHRIVDGNHKTIGFWRGDHMLEKATEIARGELKRRSQGIIEKVKESIKVCKCFLWTYFTPIDLAFSAFRGSTEKSGSQRKNLLLINRIEKE